MAIGIYDSGLGGLSVWLQLRQHLPTSFIYFGDTAHNPYGEKTKEQLEGYFREAVEFFQRKGCQQIVVACNTSSALVLPDYQGPVGIDVVGMIEAALQATSSVCSGRLGVLATRATAESGAYQKAFAQLKPSWNVFVQGAPTLVSLIEAGQAHSEQTKEALNMYLAPLLQEQIDTLLLGCTHYPFLRSLLADLLGPDIEIVDPAPALAEQLKQKLPGLSVDQKENGITEFYVSAQPEQFRKVASLLIQEELPKVRLY